MGIRRLLAFGAAALVSLAAPAAAHATDLFATVGPEFTITLRDAQNQPVTKLDPGEYRIVVEDRSEFHNFHLKGPGVDVATDIEQIGTVEWNVTFAEGRYTFVCDPHASVMHGAFVVGNSTGAPRRARRDGRAEEHDLAPAGRKEGDVAGCGELRDRRARPLEEAQLPPARPRCEPEDDGSRARHGDVEPDAQCREVRVPVRPSGEAPEGLVHRDRLANPTSPACLPPAAWMSAWRSSSAFSSAPKRSAIAE